jgi:hypothetical protein
MHKKKEDSYECRGLVRESANRSDLCLVQVELVAGCRDRNVQNRLLHTSRQISVQVRLVQVTSIVQGQSITAGQVRLQLEHNPPTNYRAHLGQALAAHSYCPVKTRSLHSRLFVSETLLARALP